MQNLVNNITVEELEELMQDLFGVISNNETTREIESKILDIYEQKEFLEKL